MYVTQLSQFFWFFIHTYRRHAHTHKHVYHMPVAKYHFNHLEHKDTLSTGNIQYNRLNGVLQYNMISLIREEEY